MKSKTPRGDLIHVFDFGQRMPVGEEAVGVGVSIQVQVGSPEAPLLSFQLLDYDFRSFRINFTGGQSGIVYAAYCAIETSAGNIYYDVETISVIGD